jgi:hypothetical protein
MLSIALRDVALNANHDWDLSSGSFKFTSGADGVAQAINVAIRFHKGEWFRDALRGVPYFQRPGVPASEAILGQRNAQDRALSALGTIILSIDGVTSLVQVSAQLVVRAFRVGWTVGLGFDDLATATLSGNILVQR